MQPQTSSPNTRRSDSATTSPMTLRVLRSLEHEAAPVLSHPLDLDVDEVHAAGSKHDELNALFQRVRRPFHLIAGMRMLSAGMRKRERDDYFEPVRETFGAGSRRAVAILYNGENHADRTPTTPEYREIRDAAFEIANRERILHWEIEFPVVMADGGFDAVIGNPPWDRIKLQEVEWWAARDEDVARARTAAERKSVVAARRATGDPVVRDFDAAAEQAAQFSTVIRKGGDYPLLGKGDINLYSLFVERSIALLKPDGICGLLTPSGIYADKTAAGVLSLNLNDRPPGRHLRLRESPLVQSRRQDRQVVPRCPSTVQVLRHDHRRPGASFSRGQVWVFSQQPSRPRRRRSSLSTHPRGFRPNQSQHRHRANSAESARRGDGQPDLSGPSSAGRSLRSGRDQALSKYVMSACST